MRDKGVQYNTAFAYDSIYHTSDTAVQNDEELHVSDNNNKRYFDITNEKNSELLDNFKSGIFELQGNSPVIVIEPEALDLIEKDFTLRTSKKTELKNVKPLELKSLDDFAMHEFLNAHKCLSIISDNMSNTYSRDVISDKDKVSAKGRMLYLEEFEIMDNFYPYLVKEDISVKRQICKYARTLEIDFMSCIVIIANKLLDELMVNHFNETSEINIIPDKYKYSVITDEEELKTFRNVIYNIKSVPPDRIQYIIDKYPVFRNIANVLSVDTFEHLPGGTFKPIMVNNRHLNINQYIWSAKSLQEYVFRLVKSFGDTIYVPLLHKLNYPGITACSLNSFNSWRILIQLEHITEKDIKEAYYENIIDHIQDDDNDDVTLEDILSTAQDTVSQEEEKVDGRKRKKTEQEVLKKNINELVDNIIKYNFEHLTIQFLHSLTLKPKITLLQEKRSIQV